MASFSFDAIGTIWTIDVPRDLSADRQASLLKSITDRIESFDRSYSRFRPDSMVAEMARRAGRFRLPDDAVDLLNVYEHLYRVTGGAFTPLIGQTLSDAGYDRAYSLRPGPMRPPPPLEETLSLHWPTPPDDAFYLDLRVPSLLDFGAAGKGYLADLVGRVLEREGEEAYCVNAGGDIVYRGVHPLRVGLEDPLDETRVIGVATVAAGSICGSAGNRRSWGGLHHLIDPRTCSSPAHLLAVWTFAESGLVADAVATALYFADPAAIRDVYDFEYVLLRADGSVDRSAAAPVELFTVRV